MSDGNQKKQRKARAKRPVVTQETRSTRKAICWGARVPTPFLEAVIAAGTQSGVDPSDLMAIIAACTDRKFSGKQMRGNGTAGLLDMTPDIADYCGTSVREVMFMDEVAQIAMIPRLVEHMRSFIHDFDSLCLCFLGMRWAVSYTDADPVFSLKNGNSIAAAMRGYRYNDDGIITKSDVLAKFRASRSDGFREENVAYV